MKVNVNKHKSFGEPIITIDCSEDDQTIKDIILRIESDSSLMIGNKEDIRFLFKENDIYYIESIDNRCFLYTKTDVFDCKYKLYEVEDQFKSFIRVNKQVVLNYHSIKFFKSTLNGKLEATLNNGDRIEISRAYVPALKNLLGGIK
jgi:DNA-binding LytR/AlgR family response regulator